MPKIWVTNPLLSPEQLENVVIEGIANGRCYGKLQQVFISGALLGVIVTGETPDSLYDAVFPIVEAAHQARS